jgi:Na+-exporting ATPase
MSTEIGKIAGALQTKADRGNSGLKAFWWKIKVLLGVAETTQLQIK